MDAYKRQLLAKIDRLAAEADKLRHDDPRRDQLVRQIAALNVEVTRAKD